MKVLVNMMLVDKMLETVLVTGAAGFIGSFLCEDLIQKGYGVVGIDNLFRGNLNNLKSISTHKNFTFVELDLSQSENNQTVESLLKKYSVKTVFHLAAINGTKYFYDEPFFVLDQNIRMTQNLLSALKNSLVDYIIYTSSSEVYGDPLHLPTDETQLIQTHLVARNSYSISKATSEFYCNFLNPKQKCLILRIFNTYGPRMVGTAYGQVIPEFIHRLLYEDKFTMIGNGTQTRSFCYVKDVIFSMRSLMEKRMTGIFNVGFDDEVNILALAQILHKLENRTFEPHFLPPRPDDPKRRCPAIQKLKSVLPNLKFTDFEEGLKTTIEFYKKNIP